MGEVQASRGGDLEAAELDPAVAAVAGVVGNGEQAGTAVRTGHGLGYPHDRWEPCLLHIHPRPTHPTITN